MVGLLTIRVLFQKLMWQITFTYTVCKVYIDIRSDIYYKWAYTTQIEAREKIIL